jgi:hypothetical protein
MGIFPLPPPPFPSPSTHLQVDGDSGALLPLLPPNPIHQHMRCFCVPACTAFACPHVLLCCAVLCCVVLCCVVLWGPGDRAQQLDTQLALQGSNFGLPIALQLCKLMGGAIGIMSVGTCRSCSPVACLSSALVSLPSLAVAGTGGREARCCLLPPSPPPFPPPSLSPCV